MLTGPQQKFAEGIALGKTAAEAYADAYPKATADSARKNAPRLMANEEIKAEITRLRRTAEVLADGTVMTLIEKRILLAKIVRNPSSKDSDKIAAIRVDNELSGDNAPVRISATLTIEQLFPGMNFLPESITAAVAA